MKHVIAPVLSLLTSIAYAQSPVPIEIETFTYKEVRDLEIKLDVHQPGDTEMRPLAVWIHGGALINDGRAGIGPARQLLKNNQRVFILPGVFQRLDDFADRFVQCQNSLVILPYPAVQVASVDAFARTEFSSGSLPPFQMRTTISAFEPVGN